MTRACSTRRSAACCAAAMTNSVAVPPSSSAALFSSAQLQSRRLAQGFVNAGLPTGAGLAEELQNVRVEPQVDRLLSIGGLRPSLANQLVAAVKVRPLE